MPLKKQSKMGNNQSFTFLSFLSFYAPRITFVQKIKQCFRKISLIVKYKSRSETSINYINEKTSIVIEEVNLDAEWRTIFVNDESTPTFMLSANSI